jgi:hypothetical protein
MRSRLKYPEYEERDMQAIRDFNAAAMISLAGYTERALSLRQGSKARVAASLDAVTHSQALLVSIDVLVAELTRQLASKGWLWPAHLPLPSPEMEAKLLAAQCRRSAQEVRLRAETMTDADARRSMHQIAMNYEDLARRIEEEI